MAFTEPKYDFAATDGLTNTHVNVFGEDIATIHGTSSYASTIASANDLAITLTENVYYVTGTTQINRLYWSDGTTSRANGCKVYLIFDGSVQIGIGTTGDTNYAGIRTRGSTTFSMSQYGVLGFVFYGAWWYTMLE